MFIVAFHLKKTLNIIIYPSSFLYFACSLKRLLPNHGPNYYPNMNLSFSDGSSSLSNIDGSNSSSSSGMYGKWGVSSSATLPSSSSAGIGTSSSAAATMAVGSLTLGTGSQLQSTQGTRQTFKMKYTIKDIILMFIAKSYHLHIFLSCSQRCKYSI